MKRFIIAGHSRISPGALAYDNIFEYLYTKELQELILQRKTNFAVCLEGSDMQPVSDNENMLNSQVVNMINENAAPYSFGIDIHFNNNNPKATGTEIIVHPNTSQANKDRASYLVKAVADCLGLPVRRREASRDYIFPSETHVGTLPIIEKTKIPMMLLEVCFLNEGDMKKYKARKEDVATIIRKVMFS